MNTFIFNICHALDAIIENSLTTMLKDNPEYGINTDTPMNIYTLMSCICHNKSKNVMYYNNPICNSIVINIEDYMNTLIPSHYSIGDKRRLICNVYKHLSTLYYIKSLDIKCCKCSCIIDICNIDKSRRLGISSGISIGNSSGINICIKCLSDSDIECLVIHNTGYSDGGYSDTGYSDGGYSDVIKLI